MVQIKSARRANSIRIDKSFAVFFLIISLTILWLRFSGRRWSCACGEFLIWVGDAWSAHTSQHLFDPYSFTHLLHGFVFCWALGLIAPRLNAVTRLQLAVAAEAFWEALENSSFVIERYRQTTAALGYSGDSIVNSASDILCCALGFLLAAKLGFRRSLALFIVIEATLLFCVRDSLLLNVVMLIYPIEWLKEWQAAH